MILLRLSLEQDEALTEVETLGQLAHGLRRPCRQFRGSSMGRFQIYETQSSSDSTEADGWNNEDLST
ncbi:hypothetical protein TNCV_1262371 [Trichonephila clavipes]|nr:hypothetical protein TNCV_1262371 [Trichonephila clavipes]